MYTVYITLSTRPVSVLLLYVGHSFFSSCSSACFTITITHSCKESIFGAREKDRKNQRKVMKYVIPSTEGVAHAPPAVARLTERF